MKEMEPFFPGMEPVLPENVVQFISPAEWRETEEKGFSGHSDFTKMDIEERPFLIGNWFRRGDLGYVFASRGVGKSWFALLLADALGGNEDFGPWQSHGVYRVLYLDGEMPASDVQARVRLLNPKNRPREIIWGNHEIIYDRTGKVMNIASSAFQEATVGYCVDHSIDVVIADNLSCLASGMNENDNLDWEKINPWMLTLRRNHIASIFVHHAGRGGRDMRGGSRREDPAFWIIRLDPPNDDSLATGARFISRFTKWRNTDERPQNYLWNFEPENDFAALAIHWEKGSSTLELFCDWVSSGLDTASAIAAEMELSMGTVSKLAKKAEAVGRITIRNRRYLPRA